MWDFLHITKTTVLLNALMFFSICSGCSWADQGGKSMIAEQYFTIDDIKSLANAAANGDLDTIKYLVKKGVNVNFIGKEDMTPLSFALIHGNKKGVSTLLEYGANPNFIASNGASVVVLSAMTDDDFFLKEALLHGGDPNIVDPKSKNTVLVQTIFYDKIKNAQLLLNSGADVNGTYSEGDDTPMLVAASADEYEFVVLFLQHMSSSENKSMTKKTVKELQLYINGSNLMPGTDAYRWKEKARDILLKEYSTK